MAPISEAGDTTSARMEYESLYALGPLVGVADPDAVVRAAHACDELGMDTISAGASIAWAMECAERGLLGEPLAFGDGEAVLGMIEAIGARSGSGDLLADGVRRAAERVGGRLGGVGDARQGPGDAGLRAPRTEDAGPGTRR